jgi:acyl-CoA thioester hydrolase
MPFKFSRSVHLYETDLMGVVHHSNYIRYMEEARFAWLRAQNLIHLHGVEANCVFAVIDLQVSYKAPLRWGDEFEVELHVVQMRSRFRFEATIRNLRQPDHPVVSQGVVILACVNNKLQPIKPPGELKSFFDREAALKAP